MRRNQRLDLYARQHRSSPTRSEAALFAAIRGGRIGVLVRRQVVLGGRFIADLVVPSRKLVIEIDGPCHRERRAADARRDRVLRRLGYSVLRLDAELVERDVGEAVRRIRLAVGL